MAVNFEPINIRHFEGFLWTHMSKEIAYPIVEWHRELMHWMRVPRAAVAAPRSFAKSTYFSYFYPLYLALERPGITILLISATGALAERMLMNIRTQLDTNKSIVQFYGPQDTGKKWSGEELQLDNGSVIMAKGAGKQIRGFRPDVVICDDLETDEMVISLDQRRKFDHWFWTDLVGMMLKHGQIVVIGTILHPESFLAELVRDGRPGWQSKIYRAIKDDGTSLWPAQWPLADLNRRREEAGQYAFNQEYMNDPIPDSLRVFQEPWITNNYFEISEEFFSKRLVYFTTVDPAIELEEVNDFTAIVTCAVDQKENIYVVETIYDRMLPSEIVDTIFDVHKRWKSASIGIETVGFQKMLKYDVDREKRRRQQFPVVVELKSGGRRKELRIKALQPWFEAGRIKVQETQKELITQLLRFPSTRMHDDVIDALAYQLDLLRPAGKAIEHMNPDSFMAHIERLRSKRKHGGTQIWGNHAIRERK